MINASMPTAERKILELTGNRPSVDAGFDDISDGIGATPVLTPAYRAVVKQLTDPLDIEETDLNLELHPLCTLFPRLTGAEFESLKEDIRVNGLREPIVVHEGMILDGGNRYRACVELGIAPKTVAYDGGNLIAFVLSANLHRRHLSAGQQAAIVASAQDWAKAQTLGGNGSNQHTKKEQKCNVAPLRTVEDRATQSGASVRTQKMADKVAKVAPDLAKQVAHGEISLPAAAKKIAKPAAKPIGASRTAPKIEVMREALRQAQENHVSMLCTYADLTLTAIRAQDDFTDDELKLLKQIASAIHQLDLNGAHP
ncbi:hypothetical protein C7H84_09520 [Burkholderia sp. Nafp2/4-1b]|uniref:ParB/RepB/Spo0J family partition protein n=1 Tax=Burkholderia sp. Nafp2/4-1b TaxID=2116686 RepID=UPI000F1D8E37|nr:ParB N-terminal domain-containing protein [Burkholderia sp. Nafp2/4-1b]RKU03367.1 hypothetical protein C7H84_09520 [Burkholderia sp. Nafp2/4-1b]